MARDRTDGSPPNFQEAVSASLTRLQNNRIGEVKHFTRSLMTLNLASQAERWSLNDMQLGTRSLFGMKVGEEADYIPQLIKAAEWHPVAFEAAGILAARFLKRQETMPDDLRVWAMEALSGKEKPPMPKNERKGIQGETWWRDFYVWSAVCDLVEEGMYPTRNAASAPHSACDAVAAAMKKLGLNPMSYSAVYSIWRKYQRMDDRSLD
ncbi:hypothetical protein SAMN05443999_102315 [Roseovarius azorensis]|uniref:Uncharacterized protein n=1 Tax=Roseovarius azorensis TaxID=1287727 RepID=A0A1H7K3K2_9RHOB|nr:hypothetical protein [Roseovarius azorensis]SEK81154.1 hypothetical protein SAMN05443999_102315 [Roseovarius azorensis]